MDAPISMKNTIAVVDMLAVQVSRRFLHRACDTSALIAAAHGAYAGSFGGGGVACDD